MERLVEGMKAVERKQGSLKMLAQELHSQANSILRFTLEWKELESHFESMKEGLTERGRELALQEKEVGEAWGRVRVKEVEVEGFFRELREKEGELCLIQGKVLERESELERKVGELGFVKHKVEECTEELRVKERGLELAERRLNDLRVEVAGKEVELGLLRRAVEEQRNELTSKTKEVDDLANLISDSSSRLELKEKELNEVQESIERCNDECRWKEIQLGDLEKRSKDCCAGLDSKRNQLDLMNEELAKTRNLVEEQQRELHSNEGHLGSIKEMIEEFGEELEKKEAEYVEVLKSVKDKEKQLQSLDTSIESSVKNLELKEAQLSALKADIDVGNKELSKMDKILEVAQSQMNRHSKELQAVKEQKLSMQSLAEDFARFLESKDKSLGVVGKYLKGCLVKLESKVTQLNSIQSKLFICHRRLTAKGQSVDSMKGTLEKSVKELEKQVEQFRLREEELESKQKLLEERCAEVEARDKQLNSVADLLRGKEQLQSTTVSIVSCVQGNGRNLQLLLNEHFKKLDSLHSELWTALQKSPDPAKLVLEGIMGFYSVEGSGEYELAVTRKSCITLLEFLSRISPTVKPEVLKESMELARDWKSKLGIAPGNSLEVLGLVKLISAFGLPLGYKSGIFTAVYPNRNVEAKEAWQALELAENLAGSFILSPVHPTSDGLMCFSTLHEASSPQLLPDEPLPSGLSENEVTNALRNSPDPAKMIFNLIEDSLVHQESKAIITCNESVLRYQVLLLQQLSSVSPVVTPHGHEAARRLAVAWRGSLRLEAMDILAFLLFLAAYGLATHFEEDDVLKLAGRITHYKKSPDLWRALGLTMKVPGLIQSLVKKDMYVEAARFSCAFGLVNAYSPDLLLLKLLEKRKLLEHGKLLLESQCEAFDKHMDYLKQLLERVLELNFDPTLFSSKLISHFQDMAMLLERKRSSLLGVFARLSQPQPPRLQGGSMEHGAIAVPNDIPSYMSNTNDQVTQQWQQPQHVYWSHEAQRNKRPRAGMQ
ncbi:unnamed protein product [Linum tenue]|uniref:FRIGIDA-like protein n=1 Tax=Linum tenue TaxID=586396 RepID=A0AAV0HGJ5_9ROSI|nr:unnamed protein product [Linum tenue]